MERSPRFEDDQLAKELVKILKSLAKNPAAVVASHGKLTGHCAFCNLELSDPRSKAAGFGEICAKKFGLHDQWRTATQRTA